jgi:hypothetical protein
MIKEILNKNLHHKNKTTAFSQKGIDIRELIKGQHTIDENNIGSSKNTLCIIKLLFFQS